MKNLLLSLLAISMSFSLFSQDNFKSIHQSEWEEHLNDEHVFLSKNTVTSVNPLQPRDSSGIYLSHTVFGYLPDWKRNSAPQYFQYDLLSHIALFDFTVSTSGNISGYPAGWPNDWTTMMNTAHANGVKLIMCVVEFNDDDINAIIHDSTASYNFYENVATIIKNYNLDGVNIDFEGPKTSDRGAPMNKFMRELSDYIKTHVGPEQEISFAGPAVNWSGWDLPGLVDACDYVFIMGYAYWWNGASTTGPCAPITGSSNNLVQTIVNQDKGYGACDKSKLILGLPYYGNKWKVSSSQRSQVGASTLESGSSAIYASTMALFNTHGKHRSSKYEDTWTYYSSGNTWYQAWCNDAMALDAKEELVYEFGLMGTGMWALGYDENRPELWDKLRENFLIMNDSLILDDFENGKGHFYRNPGYSGSSKGISSDSYIEITGLNVSDGDSCLKIVLKDDSESTENWKVRLLSGGGIVSNNTLFPRERELFFSCKTSENGIYASVMIDDGNELESSILIPLYGDGQWHEYSVRLDSCELWTSYYNGNGSIDNKEVTLDALMFQSGQQSADKIIYLDDIKAIKINDPISVATLEIPETHVLFPNYPNPFNPHTTINFQLSNMSDVDLKVYDIKGRIVDHLINETISAGNHQLLWNASNFSAGMYIAVLNVNGTFAGSTKMLLIK